MVRPRLKSYTRRVAPGEITLVQDAGVEILLPDPDGQVVALLNLLDGTRTIAELADAAGGRISGEDLAAGVAALDEAGLLEDAAAQTDLDLLQQERYTNNLAFFATFASLDRSRYQFQATLRRSQVLLLGVGGVGSTVLLQLAGLGVGRITVVDCDRVELKNVARQFLFAAGDVGAAKVERAAARAIALNPEVVVTTLSRRIDGPGDIAPLLPGADLVVATLDTPDEVLEWVNAACVPARVPFVTGGVHIGQGAYYSVHPGHSGCLACLRAQEAMGGAAPVPHPDRVHRGIAPVGGLIASLIGLEALRYLSGFAPPVANGKYWVVDVATGQVAVGLEWQRRPECPLCGPLPPEQQR